MQKAAAAPQVVGHAQLQWARMITAVGVFTFAVIVLGGATRVFDAGMSCPDWPLCYGRLVPFPTPEEGYWVAGQQYTWWQVALEWGHRLAAAITGFLLLAAYVMGYKQRTSQRKAFLFAHVPLVLLLLQVKLGGVTVWLSNINWSVALHLGCAMLFFASLVVWRRLVVQPAQVTVVPAPGTLRLCLIALWVGVFATMVLGAMVSSSHVGGVCGGLFRCMGQWLPADASQALHMSHRFAATAVVLLWLAFGLLSRNSVAFKASFKGLGVLLGGQVALGVFTLYSFSHFAWGYHLLSVVHLAWGTLLFMAVTGTLCKLFLGMEGSYHDRLRVAA